MTPSLLNTPEAPATTDAGFQYFYAYHLSMLQAQALAVNKREVSNFNHGVASAALQAQGGPVRNPAPTTLKWQDVDPSKVKAELTLANQPAPGATGPSHFNSAMTFEDAVTTKTIQMPPGSTANIRTDGTLQIVVPATEVPAMLGPIGPSMGFGANGHELFAVPAAARPFFPDGTSLPGANGSRYVMHVYSTPFIAGGSHIWELVPATPTPQASIQDQIAELTARLKALQNQAGTFGAGS